jgi:hypothetical protein
MQAAMRGPGRGLAPFGFNDGSVFAGQASADLVTGLHREIGAGLIRFALDWRRVEPNRGDYDFSAEDSLYCAALERGIAPVITIAAAPSWASDSTDGCGHCLRPPTADHLDDLRTLATIVAARYPGAAAIEAWNEPNLPIFWESPDPSGYVEVLRAVKDGVAAAGGRVPVLGGSLANAGGGPSQENLERFVAEMYARGAGSLMDGVSIHPYPVFPAGDSRQRFDRMINLVTATARRHGKAGQPIWITELGLRTDGGVDHEIITPEEPGPAFSPAEQARTMTLLYRKASLDPRIQAVIFHTLIEPDGRVASSGGYGWVDTIDGHVERKPVWCSLLALTRPAQSC